MKINLVFNSHYKTLDLHGKLPIGWKTRVVKSYTYNPALKIYQSAVTLESLQVALKLGAKISNNDELEIAKLIQESLQDSPSRDDSTAKVIENSPTSSESYEESAPIGYIIRHLEFGLGRIEKIKSRAYVVRFFSPPTRRNLTSGFSRALIPINTWCETQNGSCIVKNQKQGLRNAPHLYLVEFENGLSGELFETQLIPIKIERSRDPLGIIAGFQHEGYPVFSEREQLKLAYTDLVRRGRGGKSLLSSRIDLHPHQAYIAGTIILDDKQRYLLADEVGLGKTIEAGIVIHDFLSRKTHTRILILCPGALVQQWFSEMYSKFSGVIFRLPELSGDFFFDKEQDKQIILSFHTALANQQELLSQQWDLIVVDEVHHLLRLRPLYELVRGLSGQHCGLLLLSALPAQHRDEEYYSLLTLLEPQRYKLNDQEAHNKFSQLFERQREIGGRIGVVKRRLLESQEEGDEQGTRVIKQISVLMNMPVLQEDQFLKGLVDNLDPTRESFFEDVYQIIHHISDYYRINRRILRNRREKLIESEQLTRIKRKSNVISYLPDQYEIEALSSLDNLLQNVSDAGLREDILFPLSTQLFQSAAHPDTLLQTLRVSEHQFCLDEMDKDYEKLYDLVSYAEWSKQLEYFWKNAKNMIDQNLLHEAISAAEEWQSRGDNENFRFKEIISLLEKKHQVHPDDKLILFAGYPNLAAILTNQFKNQFGNEAIAQFCYGMHIDPVLERELKEKEVRRFSHNQETWLLVCDETGGEGRNFQFAAELIHYDIPWQAAKIEQRIGRLDRMGRVRSDVLSNLVVAKGSKEDAWLSCLSDGLEIFDRSLSGLEFALRDIEFSVVRNLLSYDDQVLWDMPPHIRKRVTEERALDESQNQMDEASFERIRAEEFRRVQSSKKQEVELEAKFIQYFKMISAHRSFRVLHQDGYSKGIIEFHPEDVRTVKLSLTEPNKSRTGTFYREIAQSRPDLEFFSIGNDFFDSVCHSLFSDPTGRTYAVECTTAEYSTWRGFEFSYRLKLNSSVVSKNYGGQNLLDYIFAERIEYAFVSEDSKIPEFMTDLLRLRKSFNKQNKGRLWKNITKNNITFLSSYYPKWQEFLSRAEKVAKEHVRERYNHILAPKIDAQFVKFEEQVRTLQVAKPGGWEDQIRSLDLLKDAINAWDLELDAVGFLSVNGGIFNA